VEQFGSVLVWLLRKLNCDIRTVLLNELIPNWINVWRT